MLDLLHLLLTFVKGPLTQSIAMASDKVIHQHYLGETSISTDPIQELLFLSTVIKSITNIP